MHSEGCILVGLQAPPERIPSLNAAHATHARTHTPLSTPTTQVSWRTPILPDGAFPEGWTPTTVSLSYIIELDALFIALSSGELLLLHADSREVEEVGAIQDGVEAAAWSPDGEVLAVVGAGGKLLLLSKVGGRSMGRQGHVVRCPNLASCSSGLCTTERRWYRCCSRAMLQAQQRPTRCFVTRALNHAGACVLIAEQ